MNNPYEDAKLLGEYLLFHYGTDGDIMPWDFGPTSGLQFPRRTVEELVDVSKLSKESCALDIGCAVGGSSFELSKICQRTLGIDYSKSFIDAANNLKDQRSMPYRFLVEGRLYADGLAQIDIGPGEVEFKVGDACDLPNDLGSFDIVHAANLICRLPNPMLFLDRLPELVKEGGQLLLATPFTWLEEFTPSDHWLGSGDSEQKLQELLSPHFILDERKDLPFVIREHRRKFQFSVSLGTRWLRVH
jgi:putative 4-mercaptohistidine N1-methyltranferase